MGKSGSRGERRRRQRQIRRMMRREGEIACNAAKRQRRKAVTVTTSPKNLSVWQNPRGHEVISHLALTDYSQLFFITLLQHRRHQEENLSHWDTSPLYSCVASHKKITLYKFGLFVIEQVKVLLMFTCSYESSNLPFKYLKNFCKKPLWYLNKTAHHSYKGIRGLHLYIKWNKFSNISCQISQKRYKQLNCFHEGRRSHTSCSTSYLCLLWTNITDYIQNVSTK